MNIGFCSKCKKKVPIKHVQRDGKEFLEKECPDCGSNYELIYHDAEAYKKKYEFMEGLEYAGCNLNCNECNKHKPLDIVFVETTNRCNMNCPICITNVPAMGFEFEPRMEYFDRIFKHYASFEFPPSMQLFGGEPTVREDLFEIIDLARSYGLSVRVVTNGLKLADPEYCDKLIKSGASILISFDGLKKEMYEKLRGSAASLDIKLKAFENLSKHKKGKVILMTVMDKNMNGDDMPAFLEHCLKHSDIIRGIFPMPLSHVWSEERLEYDPERTTQDDVEKIIDDAVEGKVQFIPLGSFNFRNLARTFKVKNLPFVGVHHNCESFTLLISNGKRYVALRTYFKHDFVDLIKGIRKIDRQAGEYIEKGKMGKIKKLSLQLGLLKLFIKHINFGAVVGAKGLKAVFRWCGILSGLLVGKKFKDIIKAKTEIKSILQIIILPFEDDGTQESERLERCSSGYAFIDVETEEIRAIPLCIWEKYKEEALWDNAVKYNKEGYTKGLKEKKKEKKNA